MKKETFNRASFLNEKIIALKEQLNIWNVSEGFEDRTISVSENPNSIMAGYKLDTSYIPFDLIKSVMVGVLTKQINDFQNEFDSL